jgi:signal transduction histidine kinase
MSTTYDTFVLLGVILINGLFGLTIFLRNIKGRVNILYAATVLAVFVWSVANYTSNHVATHHNQLLANRVSFAAGLLLVLMAWLLSSFFPAKSPHYELQLKIAMLTSPLLLIAVFTSLVINDVSYNPSESITNIQTGDLYPVFIISVLTFLSFITYNFFDTYKKSFGLAKIQISYSALGVLLAFMWILLTSALIPAITHKWGISKVGSVGTVFFVGATGYAIVRHRLFDIRLVVARSVAYFLLLTTLAGSYSLLGFAVIGLFSLDQASNIAQETVYAILAVTLAFIFQPLRRFFQKITDSFFYRGGYDAEQMLGNLGEIMAREIELGRLTTDVIAELTTQMKLSKAVIVVLDEDKIFYEANNDSTSNKELGLDELKQIGNGVVLKDSSGPEDTKKIFDKYDLDISTDLKSSNELVGYLLLGGKKSGDIFNTTDIKTLNILAHELAIAIHNAKSYTQIQNFNKTLQKRIDEATEQLRDANEHLKELDQLKNEFLSMATHQLNTPLTVVDGYLTLINDGVVNEPEERRDYLEKTLERVRGMKRMVADFLNVSRIETGKFIIDVKPVDFNKLVSEEVNGLGPSAKEKEVLLQFMSPKHPVPMVEIDEQKTRQAVMNLIDNAIYYTPKGEVKVFLDMDKDNITFKVVDNGIGVPENQKSKLFGKFFRADNARQERPNGNGVGLYLVKRIIEEQSGKIIFESTQGKGSTFGFILPIKSKIGVEQTVAEQQKEPAKTTT